jgi:hypothetical protein
MIKHFEKIIDLRKYNNFFIVKYRTCEGIKEVKSITVRDTITYL